MVALKNDTEFDAESTCAAMQEEIEWQLEEWKREQLNQMEEWT
jgi:hypothetical protein